MRELLQILPMSAITVGIEYRLACKALSARIPKVLAFCVMLTVQLMAGMLNMRFHIAASGGANILYYGVITLLLYSLLFRGNIVKKLFFTVFVRCGVPISFFILLPFSDVFLTRSH